MPRPFLLAPLAAVLALTACGGGGTKPFMPAATAKCLRQHDFRVSTRDADVPLVESSAAYGGLKATPPDGGNTLVMGFAADAGGAADLEKAIRRVAPATLRPHLRDVMTSRANAVLLWTVSPTPAQQQTVLGCLSS